MASVLRKRKIIDGAHGSTPSQPSIAAFGRITKSASSQAGKKSSKIHKKVAPACSEQSSEEPQKQQKKRKLEHVPEAIVNKSLNHHPLNVSSKVSKPIKAKSNRSGPSYPDTPKDQRRIAPLKKSSKVTDSPTKGARAILEAFVLTPVPTYKPQSSNRQDASTQSSSSTTQNPTSSLPQEFQDLLALHAAFLSSLSLHYAHNGTSSPAILSELRPSIERTWGRRRIEAGDIQRLLGIQYLHPPTSDSVPTLSLVDFGRSKLGVEYTSRQEIQSYSSPLPTAALRDLFTANIHALHTSTGGDATLLPLQPIVPFTPQRTPSAPSKGALRLIDIRATASAAQAATAISDGLKISASTAGPSGAKPASRGASLLERIRAKEVQAASRPKPDSEEQVLRRAALMRLEEIIPVIEALANRTGGVNLGMGINGGSRGMSSASEGLASALGVVGGARKSELGPVVKTASFTMSALVQHLQMSLKHPVGKEEAERCVALLAREVLPAWVQIREIGKVKSVSVRGSVGRAEWVGRLRELTDTA
ncbi:MAG: hypothetical protein MMC23_001599 [Stictis urceolatum]|nr:hypothetical protein [Stictis urceolata]